MQRPLSRQQTLSQTMCMRRMRGGSLAGWIVFLRSVVFNAYRTYTTWRSVARFSMGIGTALAIITSTAPPDDPGSTTPMSDAPHAETYLCRSMFWRALRVGAVLVTVVGLTAVDGAVLTPNGGIVVSLRIRTYPRMKRSRRHPTRRRRPRRRCSPRASRCLSGWSCSWSSVGW
jgi:hypothetical protein